MTVLIVCKEPRDLITDEAKSRCGNRRSMTRKPTKTSLY